MRTITVSLSTIRKAIKRANEAHDDWQAEMCEILLIPAINRRWKELNADINPGLEITAVSGRPYKRHNREDNLAVDDWTGYAGYILTLRSYEDGGALNWNSVRADWYGHSPATAWDGIRRETIHSFLEAVRAIANGHEHHEHDRALERAKIRITGRAAATAVA